jgi:phospholipid/cholesterol/gamma-HCH transport system permease protein
MEVSGTNPLNIYSHNAHTTLMLPLLIIMGDAIALFGSALVENFREVSYLTIISNKVLDAQKFKDIVCGYKVIFSLFFAITIGCCRLQLSQRHRRELRR